MQNKNASFIYQAFAIFPRTSKKNLSQYKITCDNSFAYGTRQEK
jgi:hypothetical protein